MQISSPPKFTHGFWNNFLQQILFSNHHAIGSIIEIPLAITLDTKSKNQSFYAHLWMAPIDAPQVGCHPVSRYLVEPEDGVANLFIRHVIPADAPVGEASLYLMNDEDPESVRSIGVVTIDKSTDYTGQIFNGFVNGFKRTAPDVQEEEHTVPLDREEFDAFEREFREFITKVNAGPRVPGFEVWGWIEPTSEKILEYYLSLKLLPFTNDTVYMDVASCMSYFPFYVREKTGGTVIRQDLLYPDGTSKKAYEENVYTDIATVGSFSSAIPVESNSLDFMTLHCSLEHFVEDADKEFFQEVWRVLKPGGKILIIPFYCGDVYTEVWKPHFAPGCRYHRYYSPAVFGDRILKDAPSGSRVDIHLFPDVHQWGSDYYCYLAAVLSKSE